MTEPTVIAQFDAVAATQPRKVCIFWGSDRITNAALAARIHAYGARLQAAYGVGRGDRVGILLKNCPEFIFALYAVLKLGATVVPINSFLKAPEIQHIADDCQLKCLITSAEFDETISKLQGVTPIVLPDLERGAPATPPRWATVEPDDLALIIYTSGTTGKAKGAMLTHGNIASNVGSCIKALEETSYDRLTLLLPMFHSFMLTVCIFTPLSMGAAIVLIKSVQPFKSAMRE
ncbi:MAG TPA: AMP-binding protein, partial [Verrucomicrobiae bacterium]|nr:AMP-binding protein [Verrucomicrobiae bacterium]